MNTDIEGDRLCVYLLLRKLSYLVCIVNYVAGQRIPLFMWLECKICHNCCLFFLLFKCNLSHVPEYLWVKIKKLKRQNSGRITVCFSATCAISVVCSGYVSSLHLEILEGKVIAFSKKLSAKGSPVLHPCRKIVLFHLRLWVVYLLLKM